MKGVLLAFRHRELVRNLPGFKKSNHRVPDEVNARTQLFVGKLGEDRVRLDLDHVFDSLRAAFRFKRTELQAIETEEGAGSITTPFFRYTSCVYQNPSDASEAILQRDVSEIAAPDQLLTDNFAAVFGDVFDTVEFVPQSAIDLEVLIDRIEELDDPRVSLAYDRQVSCCEITIAGTKAKIQVTADAFRIIHPEPQAPRILVESFFSVQNALVDFSTLVDE